MGLAPYGEPEYVDLILDQLIDLKDDGTFRLNMDYFNYATGLTMTNARFAKLFGAPARTAESTITQKEMDIARSIQEVTEEVVLRLARTVHQELQTDYLCLAGGVALNCVANGRILREGPRCTRCRADRLARVPRQAAPSERRRCHAGVLPRAAL